MTVRPTSVIILNQFARRSWLNGVQGGGLPLLQQQCPANFPLAGCDTMQRCLASGVCLDTSRPGGIHSPTFPARISLGFLRSEPRARILLGGVFCAVPTTIFLLRETPL